MPTTSTAGDGTPLPPSAPEAGGQPRAPWHPVAAQPADRSALILPRNLADQMQERGYAVIRNLLNLDDIRSLRESCEAFFLSKTHMRSNLGRNMPDATRHVPAIHWLYSHPNVLAAFRAALGRDDIVFTRHCDVAMNRLSSWHRDSGGPTPYFSGDYIADDECRVYKMALYLQPHGADGNGLWVRHGTHRKHDQNDGEIRHLETELGDAVVFDVRLTHSGQFGDRFETWLKRLGSLILRTGNRKHDHEALLRIKESYWRLRGKRDKYSIFFTFGSPNEYTREFCERNMERQLYHLRQFDSTDTAAADTELIRELQSAEVRVFGADY